MSVRSLRVGDHIQIVQEHHPRAGDCGHITKIEQIDAIPIYVPKYQIRLHDGSYTVALRNEIKFLDGKMESKPQRNDYVQVEDPESPHHGKTGWVEWIDTTMQVLAPYGVKFKDENGASNFSAKQLEVIGTFEREDRPAEMKKDRVDDPIAHALAMVQIRHYPKLDIGEIYVVWFCAALQNWKALVSTNVKDNCYYEVTHDGTKNWTYVDQYIKVENTGVDLNSNTMHSTAYPDMRFDR